MVFAKSTIYQAKLTCEFIVNSPGLDRAPYNMMVTGFTISYPSWFAFLSIQPSNEFIKLPSLRDTQLQITLNQIMKRNLFLTPIGYDALAGSSKPSRPNLRRVSSLASSAR